MKKKVKPISLYWKFAVGILIFCIVGIGIARMLGIRSSFFSLSEITGVSLRVKTIHENTKQYSIKAEYPEFGGELGGLDKAMSTFVWEQISTFKKDTGINWEERIKTARTNNDMPKDPFSFILAWDSQQMNDRYISIILRVEEYTGGANMTTESMTFNYDVKRDAFVKLADLFPGDPAYLEKIAVFTKEDLNGQLKDNGGDITAMIAEGTSPKEENFSRFTFDDNTIVFYFPKYQVAPGAYGEQKVIMGRKGM